MHAHASCCGPDAAAPRLRDCPAAPPPHATHHRPVPRPTSRPRPAGHATRCLIWRTPTRGWPCLSPPPSWSTCSRPTGREAACSPATARQRRGLLKRSGQQRGAGQPNAPLSQVGWECKLLVGAQRQVGPAGWSSVGAPCARACSFVPVTSQRCRGCSALQLGPARLLSRGALATCPYTSSPVVVSDAVPLLQPSCHPWSAAQGSVAGTTWLSTRGGSILPLFHHLYSTYSDVPRPATT